MPTTRSPIVRSPLGRITPEAIRLFMAMQRCRCSCEPDRDWVRKGRCPGCERWSDLHYKLHRELGCYPWEDVLPAGDERDDKWGRRARTRKKALEAAVKEARRQAKAAAGEPATG
jgi:hypothetical protein